MTTDLIVALLELPYFIQSPGLKHYISTKPSTMEDIKEYFQIEKTLQNHQKEKSVRIFIIKLNFKFYFFRPYYLTKDVADHVKLWKGYLVLLPYRII